jgi:hypothetical protein
MTKPDGDRPQGNPRPPAPRPISPRPSALDDPATLSRAARILRNALARQGLTIGDLRAPAPEHVRAA